MKHKKLILILSLFIIVIVYIIHPYLIVNKDKQHEVKDQIIRFHVIANSDSPEDQNLKLKIRDEILDEMGEKFSHSVSVENSRNIIEENMEKIRYIAEDEIKKEGKDYEVEVSLCRDKFPTKNYGDLTLPAGEYEALKVVIGEGKGKNWWCVMFPPLCFVDITHSISTPKSTHTLLVENKPKIVPKSKVAEVFQRTKVQLAKILMME